MYDSGKGVRAVIWSVRGVSAYVYILHGLRFCSILVSYLGMLATRKPYIIHHSYMDFTNVTWLCGLVVLKFSDNGQTVFGSGACEVTSFSATS